MNNRQDYIFQTIFFIYFLLIQNVTAIPQPVLLKDINTTPTAISSNPDQIVNINGIVYFVATDEGSGSELWKSDGTEAGTILVKDIRSSNALSVIDNLTNVNGTLFFSAWDGFSNTELWKSDGTSIGTIRVKKTQFVTRRGNGPQNLVNANGILYYFSNRYELWKSDGTEQGTTLVKDLFAVSQASPSELTYVNGTLFFSVGTEQNGTELWKSDGAEAGTVLVKDIAPGNISSNPTELTNIDGILFFSADNGVTGKELWISDGTKTGTQLVKDIFPGSVPGNPQFLTNFNGLLFFVAVGESLNINNEELWMSDGTEAGTIMVKDITGDPNSSSPRDLTVVGNTLFFSAFSATDSGVLRGLWKSDGTKSGTVLVKNNPSAGGGYPKNLTNINGTLFYRAKDGLDANDGLWKSDGTTAGTIKIKEIDDPSRPILGNLVNVNGIAFFAANDGIHGTELWKSDGTENGTSLVKDIFSLASSSPLELTDVNGTLFFIANNDIVNENNYFKNNEIKNTGLWKSDGTPAGTVLVKDLAPSFYERISSNSHKLHQFNIELTESNGLLFFVGYDEVNGAELWKSDGTSSGTQLVKNINFQSADSNPRNLVSVNNTLFFTATDEMHGRELWRSDGTVQGTYLVKNIAAGVNGSNPVYLTNVNGVLYFRVNGPGLWKSDGTTEGTELLKNISINSPIHIVNNTLFFRAYNKTFGLELWRSDGTNEGTFLVKDINQGTEGSNPSDFTNIDDTLFFRAFDDMNGYELWKSDGTSEGTILVKDIFIGTSNGFPRNLINKNNTLYFSASNEENGRSLWKSDGTESGTLLVKTIRPSSTTTSATRGLDYLINVNDRLYFNADDGINGNELWQSDGTEEGTVLVKDIAVGSGSSNPAQLININNALFFTAYDEEHGTELWTINNNTPVANNDTYSLDANTTLLVPAPGLLDNDTDPNGDSLAAVLDSIVSNGSISLDNNGSFSYTPTLGYSGTDSFTYFVTNGEFDSETATVELKVKMTVATKIALIRQQIIDLKTSSGNQVSNRPVRITANARLAQAVHYFNIGAANYRQNKQSIGNRFFNLAIASINKFKSTLERGVSKNKFPAEEVQSLLNTADSINADIQLIRDKHS